MQRTFSVGQQVKINGRNYVVEAVLAIGPAVAKVCPWIVAQYGIRGLRGSLAMMQLQDNGMGKLIFTNRSRAVESFITEALA